MAEGQISAHVYAPPRLLVVDVPSAAAVDLGCAYTLRVARDGRSHLTVTSGWVALESPDRGAFVPAGAEAWTAPGEGPSTPVFVDAPDGLRDALARLDGAFAARRTDDDALRDALAAAR